MWIISGYNPYPQRGAEAWSGSFAGPGRSHVEAFHLQDPGCAKAGSVFERWAVRVCRDDGRTTVAVLGEIDLTAAPGVRAAIANALALEPSHLVIDLTDATSMDVNDVQGLVVASSGSKPTDENRR
jgi:hypothetical protein